MVYTTNIQSSSLGHQKFAIDQWQTSSDLGLGLYTPNSRGSYDILYYGEAIPLAYKCCTQCAIYLQ